MAVAAAMYYFLHLRRVSAVVRRAAFDIGSGYTKMLVADVKDGAIVGRVVLETEVKLSYKVDAQQSSDGSLSEAIQAEGLACFRELTAKALTLTLTLTLTLALTLNLTLALTLTPTPTLTLILGALARRDRGHGDRDGDLPQGEA